jgi:glycosyltransferase involved in cell wall biosynthesis
LNGFGKCFIPFNSQFNHAKLLVVGKNPNEAIYKLCKMGGIELYANVPDVRPYYAKSRAVIVPILKGGGTRIKILEAMLADRPVLATPMGAEGLGFENAKEILLFSNPHSFISQYQLLQKREFYADITREARKKTAAEYSPKKFKENMEKVLDGIL